MENIKVQWLRSYLNIVWSFFGILEIELHAQMLCVFKIIYIEAGNGSELAYGWDGMTVRWIWKFLKFTCN